MNFVEQLIQLLSEPPGSFLYHLLVVFALQVVFAISFARYRRNPDDALAQRTAWASGAILVGELLFLLANFLVNGDPVRATLILPPVDSAITTASLALLVWSFISRPLRAPRIADIILIAILLLSAILFLFSLQAWQAAAVTGSTSYNSSTEAIIWAIFQIVILCAGLAVVLLRERQMGLFPPAILIFLLIAHVATLWNYPEFIAALTNVAYWNRLGNLVALPLWAVFMYQESMTPLLQSQEQSTAAMEDVGRSLHDAAGLIGTKQTSRRTALGLTMAQEMLQGEFTAVSFLDPDSPESVLFRSNIPSDKDGRFLQWEMTLDDNPALRTAITQDRPVELQPVGLGTRQFYAIYQSAGLSPRGPLLIQPLQAGGQRLGLLLVAGHEDRTEWNVKEQKLASGLAEFIAQALINSQAMILTPSSPTPETPAPATAVPAAILMDHERLRNMERERDDLREALAEATEARKVAETNAAAAQKQARYLAAALRVAQTPRAVVEGEGTVAGLDPDTEQTDE